MPSSSTSSGTAVTTSVPTISGVDIAPLVRLAIDDTDSSNYGISNANLTLLLGNAVKEYSRFRPYYKESTITLVDGQGDYALPSDFVKAIHIPYRSSPSVTSGSQTIFSLFNLNGFDSIIPYYDWSDSVLQRITQDYQVRLEGLGAGQAEEITYLTSYAPTRYLRLYPTPADAGSFVLRYLANHPIQNNDYFTISPFHAIYIQKLLTAEVYDAKAIGSLSAPFMFAAGTTKIQQGNSGVQFRKLASDLRQEVWDSLNSPVGAVG